LHFCAWINAISNGASKLRMYPGTLHLHSSIAIAMLAASNAEASRGFFFYFFKTI
jgi:hypothetical protein